jgi:hypothetical protein
MKTKTGLVFVLTGTIAIITVATLQNTGPAPSPEIVHIDGRLYLQTTETISVVVTAADAASAAYAVEAVGGQVSGASLMAQAVTASIPVNQLDALAIQPQVRSIASADYDNPAAFGMSATIVKAGGHNY